MSQSPGIFLSFPLYSRADGSASFGFGSSPLASASFSGPVEVHPSSESPIKSHLETHVIPLSGVPGIHERKLAQTVETTMKHSLMLEKCPRTLCQFVVQAFADLEGMKDNQNSSVIHASLINSASLAALNASSVPMRGVVCAAAVQVGEGGNISPSTFSVPSSIQQRSSSGGVFAFLFTSSNIRCVHTSWYGGAAEQMHEAEKVALARAQDVWNAIHLKVGAIDSVEEDEDDEARMEI
ncbi:exosome component Rrp46 [Flagelloscypha sp. PMI_526]|nr:exosome component Rrp46 [Flagelloscypha sp. PMI_526]